MNVTKKDAAAVGEVFFNHANVAQVEVVGSVARDGQGNDLDLVVVVNGALYASYVLAMQETADACDNYYLDLRPEREKTALKVLGFTTPFYGWLNRATEKFTLDLHLMPEGWKEKATVIQGHFSHDDPSFVSNIAKDAVELEPLDQDKRGFIRVVW